MIKSLKLKNVGPLPDATINFGKRLNIITGDNGLGKSFLLDVIWFGFTGCWPIEVNGRMTSGYVANPLDVTKEASLEHSFGKIDVKSVDFRIISLYERQKETWGWNMPPLRFGWNLVLYAHYDGSFSVWDPYRNYQIKDFQTKFERPCAFVFTPSEVWDGATVINKNSGKEIPICNGLIRDWVSWQDRHKDDSNDEFSILANCLEKLSPPDFPETLSPAEHGRISTGDSREHPFIKMPYGKIPVILASAGIRRMLALAYMLTWTITEHVKNCEVLGMEPASQMTFLFDEVDSHLHPKWQRQIMSGILNVLETLTKSMAINTQIISVTHSPLVMASLEAIFNKKTDKWLDLDLNMVNGNIQIEERKLIKMGDVSSWLTSDAFDLKSTYSVEAERAMDEYNKLMSQEKIDSKKRSEIIKKLEKLLPDTDPFWVAVDFPKRGGSK